MTMRLERFKHGVFDIPSCLIEKELKSFGRFLFFIVGFGCTFVFLALVLVLVFNLMLILFLARSQSALPASSTQKDIRTERIAISADKWVFDRPHLKYMGTWIQNERSALDEYSTLHEITHLQIK